MDFDNSAQVDALAKLPPEPAKPPERSAWSSVLPSIAGGAGKVGAAIVEGVAAVSPNEKDIARNPGSTAISSQALGSIARSARDFERSMRPDPATAGTAEQIVYGFGSGLTSAAAGALMAGPAGAAAALGAGEGAALTDDLQRQGVNDKTARIAGSVAGVVNAASVALPLAGPTLKATAGLYLLGGPGGFMAQQAATRAILENADYATIGAQFDPFDPVGLTLSALIPLPFAAHGAMRVIKAGKKAPPAAGTAPLARDLPSEAPRAPDAVSQPLSDLEPAAVKPRADIPKVSPEAVDAAMVHNLTLLRDAQEAVPVARAVHELQKLDPTSFAARLETAISERGIRVTDGERSQAGGTAGAREITMANLPEAEFMARHGNSIEDVKAHEFGHTFWAGATALPNLRDPANKALRTELKALSQEFRPQAWEAHPQHTGKLDELLADALAFWIKNPARRGDFPAVDKMMRGYDAGDLIRNFPDVRAPDVADATARPATPEPAPAPAAQQPPAPPDFGRLTPAVEQARAIFETNSKALDQYLATNDVPPEVNNLLIGLSEAGKDPKRIASFLDLVARQDGAKSAADATADAVEGMRSLTDEQLTGTTPDTFKPAIDPLMQSISDRVAAVQLAAPDMVVGLDASGNPITVADEIARIRKEAFEGTDTELGAADADLVNVAANCALSVGA